MSELVLGVKIALEHAAVGQCPRLDANADAKASIDELILAIANAFNPTHLLPCGDGERNVAEQCDDGNRVNGDGCSDACAIEGGPLLDQIWVGARPDCAGFATVNLANGSVGQEFRPTLSSLTGVAVNLLSAVSNGQGGSVGVNLRQGSLDGTIIATAETVLASPTPPGSWQRFDFVLPVAVIPEQTYVIEVFSGEDRLLWISGSGHEGCPEEHYERGDAVGDGGRNSGDDFLFAVFGTSDPGVGPIDQKWFGPEGICGIQATDVRLEHAPIGQSFTPNQSELGAVAVHFYVYDHNSGTLTLNVRQGSLTGPVIGSGSLVVTPPAEVRTGWYGVDLVPPLSLTPGLPYVIELVDPQNRFSWLAEIAGGGDDECYELEYPRGSAFVRGETTAQDFRFATFGPAPSP